MNKILIINKNFELAERMTLLFTDMETRALSCGTLESATGLLEDDSYQVIIIDPDLPDGDGYDLIYELGLGIYESKNPSIIVIIPNDRRPDMSLLSEQGIADYITKPFNIAVLKAKVWTQFKRIHKDFSFRASKRFEATMAGTKNSIVGERIVNIDDFTFNFGTGEYWVEGKQVRLSLMEQCLLRNLVENRGIVLGRRVLLDKLVSESNICIDEGALARTIRVLSVRLNARNYIKAVYGIGYIWTNADEKNC